MELVVKNLPTNAGDLRDVGSIPVLGRSPGGGHGNPLQYSCLKNPMDSGAWRTPVIWLQKVGDGWSDLAHMHSPYCALPQIWYYLHIWFSLTFHCSLCTLCRQMADTSIFIKLKIKIDRFYQILSLMKTHGPWIWPNACKSDWTLLWGNPWYKSRKYFV